MFIFAITGLVVSLAGLCALFMFKYVEQRRDRVFVPEFRARIDDFAKMTKVVIRFLVARVQELPGDLAIFLRILVHVGAIVFARGARAAEQGAHKLADRVSHKHNFERSESRSVFLKRVSEHKNGLETKR